MSTNNLFQGRGTNQIPTSQDYYMQNPQNLNFGNQRNFGYMGRPMTPPIPGTSNIPVRVVFSPNQITPQEIPTDGTPALFPLSDGSCIYAKALLQNGTFDDRRYVLETSTVENKQAQTSEFDQLMVRLGALEESINSILESLTEPKVSKGSEVKINE